MIITFLKSINYLIHNGRIEVKNRMIFYDGFEHPYYLKKYLIDGNINSNYYWLSNGLENYIDIILDDEILIAGTWLLSNNSERTPTSIKIEYFDENMENGWTLSIEEYVDNWKKGVIYGQRK